MTPLEDHAGDVARKARMMINVPSDAAAQAGHVSKEALEAFEQTGVPPAGIDWASFAARIQVDADKLRRFASSWAPETVNTRVWREFRQITTEGDGMTVNCFVVWDDKTRTAALFDTGFDAASIFALIDQEHLQLEHIFITHTHGDHVAALEPVRALFGQARLHTNAASAPSQHRNQPGETVEVGGLRVRHRQTPGHAVDGVTYVVSGFPDGAPDIAIVGDAIFAGSIGGAPGKGPETRQAIRDQILTLPASTLICPGHGPLTTVGEQQGINPFF